MTVVITLSDGNVATLENVQNVEHCDDSITIDAFPNHVLAWGDQEYDFLTLLRAGIRELKITP